MIISCWTDVSSFQGMVELGNIGGLGGGEQGGMKKEKK